MDINLFRVENSVYLKKVKTKVEVLKSDDCDGYLIDADEKTARRIVESLKKSGKIIGVVGGDDVFNRRIIETLKIDYLVSPEREQSKIAGVSGYRSIGGSGRVDNLKQRDSGLNHVVAKIARDKKVLIVFDFGSVRKLEGKEKALRISRLIQNVKICRKVKCGIRIASLSCLKGEIVGEKERKAFGASLGMSSEQVADCVRF